MTGPSEAPPERPRAAMVFAAGLGTRMGALTADRPKPLLAVAGRTLLDRALDLVEGAGAARAVVNVHYRAPQVLAHLAARPSRTTILASDESDRLLETGGGLRRALPLLGPGPVWTLNSDAAWAGPNPLAALAGAWREGMEALLLLVPLDRAEGFRGRGASGGDFALGPDGRLSRGGPWAYTGAQVIRPEGLAAIPEAAFSLNRPWDGMIARGTLFGLAYEGRWCDVGRPENLLLAERLVAREGEGPGLGDGDA